MKLHSRGGTRIRAKTDNFSHETHEKTRNIIFIFVRFRGFRGQQYLINEIKFLYWSDWTLAASGGAYMKLPQNGTVYWWPDWPKQWTDWTSNIERPTSNVEYGWRYALSILKQANRRISKSRFALLSLFFKLTEYIIRCWTFDVRCSFFS